MFKYKQITDVLARRILDGRGLSALEVEMLSEDGEIGRVSVSLNLPEEHMDEVAESMVLFVNSTVADMLIGENLLCQSHIDQILERLCGCQSDMSVKNHAIRAVSGAAARTAAGSLGIPLYQYLGGIQAEACPVLRICLPSDKEPEEKCRESMERWKNWYEKTEICREGDHIEEKRICLDQYTTVTGCLSDIRKWKKEETDTLVLKDTEYVTDAFLVDLAVAAGVDVLELRPPIRGENTVKYTQMMRILEHL